MFQAISHRAKGKGLDGSHGGCPRLSIGHHTRQCGDLTNPPAIFFLLKLYCELCDLRHANRLMLHQTKKQARP